jgi:hypothetical protein
MIRRKGNRNFRVITDDPDKRYRIAGFFGGDIILAYFGDF